MSTTHGVLSTTGELMSLEAFHATSWTFFALCVVLFTGRIVIRWMSSRKLITEDYLMLFVLCLQFAATIICQLHLKYVYMMEEVGNGLREPPATFLEDIPKGLYALTAVDILVAIGLWAVKFNFLLFFYRIFCSVDRLYWKLWWAVVVVTIASLGAFLGLMSYQCSLAEVQVILTKCTTPSAIRLQWIQIQTTSGIDAFNDVLIMIFPLAIVWRVRLNLKKKLYLSAMFMLSLFTVAMAIIRCTSGYARVASDYTQSQNSAWSWFWMEMELFVSFLVACLISFPALFMQGRKNKQPVAQNLHNNDQLRTFGNSWKKDKKKGESLFDTIVDTCHDLEGTTEVYSSDLEAGERGLVLSEGEGRSQAGSPLDHGSPERRREGSYLYWANEHGQAHSLERTAWDSCTYSEQSLDHAHTRVY